jgi:hypothetical protein
MCIDKGSRYSSGKRLYTHTFNLLSSLLYFAAYNVYDGLKQRIIDSVESARQADEI